jgi:hypothetical protein
LQQPTVTAEAAAIIVTRESGDLLAQADIGGP